MSIVDFFKKRLIAEKQLTIECHLVFDRTKIIAAPMVDVKSKNASRFAIKFCTNTLSFPFSFKSRAKLFAWPYHKKRL